MGQETDGGDGGSKEDGVKPPLALRLVNGKIRQDREQIAAQPEDHPQV
jgi:hypothetical protein